MVNRPLDPMLVQRVGAWCGIAAGPVLAAYVVWTTVVVPPFTSGEAFLQFAGASPFLALFDDWLLLTWMLLVMGLALGLHGLVRASAPEASLLALGVGFLGLLLGVMRSAFNIGRLQTLAAAYAAAGEADRQALVKLLAWTDHGDVARDLTLVLLVAWALGVGALVLRTPGVPRLSGWLGIAAGASLVPVAAGFALDVPLTQRMGFLAGAALLWVAWSTAAGLHLWTRART